MTAMTFDDTGVDGQALVRTARSSGLLYLGLCVTGLLGHFIIPGQIFDPDDAAATLNHLIERETLARLGIAMELGTVTFQALLALWFYRLWLMGWLLVIGGVGYVLYAFIVYVAPGAASIASVLVWPTVSEFWMAGYLLVKGVRLPAV